MSFLSLFLASLVGSPHCVGMCGGFVTLVSDPEKNPWISQALYHGARISVYAMLGAAAGGFGQSLDDIGAWAGVQKLAALIVGILLITQAVLLFGGRPTLDLPGSARVKNFLFGLWAKATKRSAFSSPAALGALTGLLPCGWLYSFIILAMTSGSALSGALVLLVFGAGTLPILIALGTTLRTAIAKTGLRPRKITAALLLVAGVFSLGQHMGWFPGLMSHSHHGQGTSPDSHGHHAH